MLEALVLSTPWILLGLYAAIWAKVPRPLPDRRPTSPTSSLPKVTVIVPARNEAINIAECVTTLAGSTYGNLEIVVVDDRSDDDTAEIARRAAENSSVPVRVIEGKALPEGWFGKPWACQQGADLVAADASESDLLLFTDADTTHGANLLGRAVAGLEEDDTAALSVVGTQILGSFWERLVQPQIFALLVSRYPRLQKPIRSENWQRAIANGQFILVRRGAYDAFGGHHQVRGEVVEDLRFAQLFCKAGYSISIREARGDFSTRMYRSLAEMVRGWGKNLYVGARQASISPVLKALALPGMVFSLLFFWVLPPVLLVAALLGGLSGLLPFALVTTAFGLLFWAVTSVVFGVSPLNAFGYPLGAVVAAFIVSRSWLRGSTVEWKGRKYKVDDLVHGTPSGST